jgi:hypothetical protein
MADQQIVFFGSEGHQSEKKLWAIQRKEFLQIGHIFPKQESTCVVIQKNYDYFIIPEALETIQARWNKNKEELVINLTDRPEVPEVRLANAPAFKPGVSG